MAFENTQTDDRDGRDHRNDHDDHDDRTTVYRITIDRERCDGIFACLIRDSRFVEDSEGLATVDSESAGKIEETDGRIVAEFDDDRIEKARQAAAACPPSAITVEELEGQ